MEKQEKKTYLAEHVASSLAQTGVFLCSQSHNAIRSDKNPRLTPVSHPLWFPFVRSGKSPLHRRQHLPWELQHREEGKRKNSGMTSLGCCLENTSHSLAPGLFRTECQNGLVLVCFAKETKHFLATAFLIYSDHSLLPLCSLPMQCPTGF